MRNIAKVSIMARRERSIVEYFAEHERYRCGYCGSSDTNYSHGLFFFSRLSVMVDLNVMFVAWLSELQVSCQGKQLELCVNYLFLGQSGCFGANLLVFL